MSRGVPGVSWSILGDLGRLGASYTSPILLFSRNIISLELCTWGYNGQEQLFNVYRSSWSQPDLEGPRIQLWRKYFFDCCYHEAPFPLSYVPEDLMDKNSFSMSIDLAGQDQTLKDLWYSYEGNTSSSLLFSKQHFPWDTDQTIWRIRSDSKVSWIGLYRKNEGRFLVDVDDLKMIWRWSGHVLGMFWAWPRHVLAMKFGFHSFVFFQK